MKPRTEVQYKISKEDPWKTAIIISREVKATGKYHHHRNKTDQNGQKLTIDFASVHKWETLPTIENEIETSNEKHVSKEASLKPPTNRPLTTDQLPTDQPTTGNQPPTKCTDHRPTDQQPIRNLRNRNQARIQCFKEVSQTDYVPGFLLAAAWISRSTSVMICVDLSALTH